MTNQDHETGPISDPGPNSDGSDAEPAAANFRDLGLDADVLAAIEQDLAFEQSTPIQTEAIPVLNTGKDLIGKAETGTGKTLAFCAPLIGKLDPSRGAVQALVLCPTRELAQQVEETASILGKRRGIRTALLVGGVHQSVQILRLREGAQMVVATPGRVLDFLQDGRLRLGWATTVVLDEADRMLDMGFIDDVSKILSSTPPDRQTAMFSATVPPRLQHLVKRFMKSPITVSTVKGLATVPEIRQQFVECHPGDKEGFILDLLDDHPDETTIIFCNTRKDVIELDRTLWGLGYEAGSLHGEHEQERRFKVLEAFKSRQITALVATDVAARGLDIDEVARVVNFDVPDEVETYVHRIGRTGRAGGAGESITLVASSERDLWDRICRSTQFDINKVKDWEPTRPRKKVEDPQKRRDYATKQLQAGARRAAARKAADQEEAERKKKRSSRGRSGRADNRRGEGDRDGRKRDENRRDSGRGRDSAKRGSGRKDGAAEARPERDGRPKQGEERNQRPRKRSEESPAQEPRSRRRRSKRRDSGRPREGDESIERRDEEHRGRGGRDRDDGQRSSRERHRDDAPAPGRDPESERDSEHGQGTKKRRRRGRRGRGGGAARSDDNRSRPDATSETKSDRPAPSRSRPRRDGRDRDRDGREDRDRHENQGPRSKPRDESRDASPAPPDSGLNPYAAGLDTNAPSSDAGRRPRRKRRQ